MTEMLNFILDLIFPKFCAGCDRLGTYLCHRCYEDIDFYPFPIKNEIIVTAKYEGIIRKLLITFKYKNIKGIGKTLARLVYHTTALPKVEIITSVPLHPKRKSQRGFNQATEIAQELSRITQTPFSKLLIRTRHLPAQASISDKQQRLKRLENVFEATQKVFNFGSVLIVDDVTTTGTTLNECAAVLKKAGVKQVYSLAIAHGS